MTYSTHSPCSLPTQFYLLSAGRLFRLLVLLLLLGLSGFSLGQSTNISFPGNRASFITGTTVVFAASATPLSGSTVSNVEFLIGSAATSPVAAVTTVLGADATSPYAFTWTIPAVQLSYNEIRTRVTFLNTTTGASTTLLSSVVPIDVYEPNISSNINYYVSTPPLGLSTNNGLSPATPLHTIQAALQLAKPGDVVNVMAGTYTANNNNVVTFRRTGTPTNWVTLKNYQNDRPIISTNGPNAILVTPSVAYARIQGFEVVGSNGNEPLSVTLPKAYTQAGSCANPTGTPPNIYNTNGIFIEGRNGANLHAHHIEVKDNIVHDCGGGGISSAQADYLTIENNTTYNNAWFTVYGNSGISILNSWNFDGHGSTPAIIIRNNRSYKNRLYVRWKNGGANTCKTFDGNGIILDNNNAAKNTTLGAYTGKFLIENNVSFLNGGRGININYTDNVTIINNSTYQNGATNAVNSPATGEVTDDIDNEFIALGSKDIGVYNNIFHGRPGEKVTAIISSTVTHNNNLTYEGTGPLSFTGGQNITGQDPQFVDPANANPALSNFRLTSTSPALNVGSSIVGQYALNDILGIARPQGAGVDIGAYELQGESITITQQPASASSVCQGASVTASVSVSGTVAGYQWYKDGIALTGVASATTATLSLPNVTTASAGSYSVVLSGPTTLTSTAFSLTVNALPGASLLPASATLSCGNSSVTLTASGGSTYGFSGGTALGLDQVVVSAGGTYSVIVTSINGCTATASATISADNALSTVSITANPGLTATTGSSVTLTASGADTYLWSTSATTAVISTTAAGLFSVTGTTANGCSATATATVVRVAPPTVNMVFPEFNSSYLAGSTVNILATANTPPGTTIAKVEFYSSLSFGAFSKIGEVTAPPYSMTYTLPAVTATGQSRQFRAVVTNSLAASVTQAGTGYNSVNVYPPTYVSTRNWYVSASAPASNTAATEASPFNTIQKASDRVTPGDTVFVMAGTYTSTSSDIVAIRRTGLPTRPIVFMPYRTDKPRLQMGNSNWNAINVLPGGAYVKIQGLEVVGNNATITLPQAQTQPGSCEGPNPTTTPIPRYNGNGISINGAIGPNGGAMNRPHHIVVANNYVHDCAGAGIGPNQADYVTIEDNIVANNSWYTVYGTSGISIFNSWNYDNSTDTKMIVRRNRSFGNILKIAWNIGGTGTNCRFFDGNGIILDNNRANNPNNTAIAKNPLGDYLGKMLVENNVCYLNGGRGININYTDNAIILNNTTYQNGQSDGAFGIGIDNELIMQGSIGSRIYNNIFYGKPGESPTSVSSSTDVLHNNNLTFSNFNNGYFTGNQNIVGQDPKFVDPATGNFQLMNTSPALNVGSSIVGQYSTTDILGIARPQGAGVDIGAYELQGQAITITQQPASASSVCQGTTVTASVSVSGTVAGYQWYKDGIALTGVASATTATLALPNVTTASAGSYSVVISGLTTLTSTAFSLTVNALPATSLLPASATLSCANSSLTLTASGGSTYGFSGGTGLGLDKVVVNAAGTYSVIVTSINGCTATASATVESNTITPNASLSATSTTACSPASITLTASGGNSFTFSAGATQIGSTNQAVVGQSGSYTVTVANAGGCTATASVSVTVNARPDAPTLTSVSRTVSTSAAPLSLPQFVNAANGHTLSFSGVTGLVNPPTIPISQTGVQSFSVTQINAYGCTSLPTPFSITVQQSTTTATPVSQTACRNSYVVLTVDGTGATRFEWYKNGTSAPFKLMEVNSSQKGTNTASLTLVHVQTSADYYCKVTRSSGITTVGPMRVVVNFGCVATGARLADSGEEPQMPLTVQLMPNPLTDGQLRAVVAGADGQWLSVQLLNRQGQVVRQQTWLRAEVAQTVEWNIQDRPIGIYLLQAQTLGQRKTIKVIKAD